MTISFIENRNHYENFYRPVISNIIYENSLGQIVDEVVYKLWTNCVI